MEYSRARVRELPVRRPEARATGPVSRASGGPRPPRPFLFGVATADHQCEAYDPSCPDIWDRWEREAGLTPRGAATDFWNRYPEDVELARDLGCRAFRF